jgi:hypothetical protein
VKDGNDAACLHPTLYNSIWLYIFTHLLLWRSLKSHYKNRELWCIYSNFKK